MDFKKWMNQKIRDNWHDPEFRKGFDENKMELERRLGEKLADIPIVAQLKARDRELELKTRDTASAAPDSIHQNRPTA